MYIPEEWHWKEEFSEEIYWSYIDVFISGQESLVLKIHNLRREEILGAGLYASKHPLKISMASLYRGSYSFAELKHDLQNKMDDAFIIIEFSDEILFNIGVVRAINLLLDQADHPILIAMICTSDTSDEQGLIEATTQSIAARLSGVSYILHQVADTKVATYNTQLHNILDLESGLIFEKDPISGSRYLDQISCQVYDFLKS